MSANQPLRDDKFSGNLQAVAFSKSRYDPRDGLMSTDEQEKMQGGLFTLTSSAVLDIVSKSTTIARPACSIYSQAERLCRQVLDISYAQTVKSQLDGQELYEMGPMPYISVSALDPPSVNGFALGAQQAYPRRSVNLRTPIVQMANARNSDIWARNRNLVDKVFYFGSIEAVSKHYNLLDDGKPEQSRLAFWIRGWLLYFTFSQLDKVEEMAANTADRLRYNDRIGGWKNLRVMRQHGISNVVGRLDRLSNAVDAGSLVHVDSHMNRVDAWVFYAMCHSAPFMTGTYKSIHDDGRDDSASVVWASRVPCPSNVRGEIIVISDELFEWATSFEQPDQEGEILVNGIEQFTMFQPTAEMIRTSLFKLAENMYDEPQLLVAYDFAARAVFGKIVTLEDQPWRVSDQFVREFHTKRSLVAPALNRAAVAADWPEPGRHVDTEYETDLRNALLEDAREEKQRFEDAFVPVQNNDEGIAMMGNIIGVDLLGIYRRLYLEWSRRNHVDQASAFRAAFINFVRGEWLRHATYASIGAMTGAPNRETDFPGVARLISNRYVEYLRGRADVRILTRLPTRDARIPDVPLRPVDGLDVNDITFRDSPSSSSSPNHPINASMSIARVSTQTGDRRSYAGILSREVSQMPADIALFASQHAPSAAARLAMVREFAGYAVATINGFYVFGDVLVPAESFRAPFKLALSRVTEYGRDVQPTSEWKILCGLSDDQLLVYAAILNCKSAVARVDAMCSYSLDWNAVAAMGDVSVLEAPIICNQLVKDQAKVLCEEGSSFSSTDTASELTMCSAMSFYKMYGHAAPAELMYVCQYARNHTSSFVSLSLLLKGEIIRPHQHFYRAEEVITYCQKLSYFNPIVLSADRVRENRLHKASAFGTSHKIITPFYNDGNRPLRYLNPSGDEVLAMNMIAAACMGDTRIQRYDSNLVRSHNIRVPHVGTETHLQKLNFLRGDILCPWLQYGDLASTYSQGGVHYHYVLSIDARYLAEVMPNGGMNRLMSQDGTHNCRIEAIRYEAVSVPYVCALDILGPRMVNFGNDNQYDDKAMLRINLHIDLASSKLEDNLLRQVRQTNEDLIESGLAILDAKLPMVSDVNSIFGIAMDNTAMSKLVDERSKTLDASDDVSCGAVNISIQKDAAPLQYLMRGLHLNTCAEIMQAEDLTGDEALVHPAGGVN